MSHRFSIAYFAHSLRSDWNNGNAHFTRGLIRSLIKLGHDVTVFEASSDWSIDHLREEDGGQESLDQFAADYPEITVHLFDRNDISSGVLWRELLQEIDVVIVHEWNPPGLAHALFAVRDDLHFRMLFHDTHHRASSSPEQLMQFGVNQFDGILVFGEVLRSIYRERFGVEAVWTLHEAADTSLFTPRDNSAKTDDLIWIGNWGDDERSAEIKEFLLEPASKLRDRRFRIHGVRYPDTGLAALRDAGVCYGGYLPNLAAPAAYGAARMTIHIPRQQYASVMMGIPTIRVFEALACGIPLISAPWQDCEHLFDKGDYLSVRNADEAREAMAFLLDDPKAAAAQAAQGLATVLDRHTCDHRAQQLTAILEEHFA